MDMKMKTAAKWVLGLLVAGMILQAGAAVYALVANTSTSTATEETASNESMWSNPEQAAVDVQIAQEILDKIKSSDPTHYELNVTNYKKLLTVLDVHPKFKSEIERVILANHRLPDVLIAYEFLYHSFGMLKDVEAFVIQKESGKSWEDIFKAYNNTHELFIPRAFDSDELEQLSKTSGVTSDDIMIADRISFETGKPFKELIAMKLQNQGQSWKEVNAKLNILYSASVLPRVQITADDIQNYTQSGKLSQEKVAEAFVLAYKLGQQPKSMVEQFDNGSTEETIFAEGLGKKYDQ